MSEVSQEEKDMRFKNNPELPQKNTSQTKPVSIPNIPESMKQFWMTITPPNLLEASGVGVLISFTNFSLKVTFITNFSWYRKVTKSVSDKTTKSTSLERLKRKRNVSFSLDYRLLNV